MSAHDINATNQHPDADPSGSTRTTKVAAAVLAASALGGAALLAPGLAGAQDETPDAGTPETESPDAAEGDRQPGDRMAEALAPLVEDGTLTEAQRDAVVSTLLDAKPERGDRGYRADVAGLLGLEQAELREALRDGSTVAGLADANGVDVADIVDAMVDAAEERVNAAAEAGRIDDAEAAERLADAEERAEDFVNGELEFEGRRGGPRR